MTTAGGTELVGDLYIDCTGFAALLIKGALHVPFVDYSQWLLCDRALAARIPYRDQSCEIPPYTTSKALSAGWCWSIGLQERQGRGYVFSSKFISDDEAEKELRDELGDDGATASIRPLRFQTGRRQEAWRANCVAIGLSSGFIEPLESTGIYLIEYAAQLLCELFPFTSHGGVLTRRFNQLVADRYEELLSFVSAHYYFVRRSDTPFWREVQKEERAPPALRNLTELWEIKPPSASDFRDTLQLFSDQNWEYILFGLGWSPKVADDRQSGTAQVPDHVAEAVNRLAQELPSHREYLAGLVNRSPPLRAS